MVGKESNAMTVLASLAHHTAVARKMALLFLKGVRMGSPMRALATTLPEKMTSIEESHSDSGCFREKASPAAKYNVRFHVKCF